MYYLFFFPRVGTAQWSERIRAWKSRFEARQRQEFFSSLSRLNQLWGGPTQLPTP